jgi:hypothetical protein
MSRTMNNVLLKLGLGRIPQESDHHLLDFLECRGLSIGQPQLWRLRKGRSDTSSDRTLAIAEFAEMRPHYARFVLSHSTSLETAFEEMTAAEREKDAESLLQRLRQLYAKGEDQPGQLACVVCLYETLEGNPDALPEEFAETCLFAAKLARLLRGSINAVDDGLGFLDQAVETLAAAGLRQSRLWGEIYIEQATLHGVHGHATRAREVLKRALDENLAAVSLRGRILHVAAFVTERAYHRDLKLETLREARQLYLQAAEAYREHPPARRDDAITVQLDAVRLELALEEVEWQAAADRLMVLAPEAATAPACEFYRLDALTRAWLRGGQLDRAADSVKQARRAARTSGEKQLEALVNVLSFDVHRAQAAVARDASIVRWHEQQAQAAAEEALQLATDGQIRHPELDRLRHSVRPARTCRGLSHVLAMLAVLVAIFSVAATSAASGPGSPAAHATSESVARVVEFRPATPVVEPSSTQSVGAPALKWESIVVLPASEPHGPNARTRAAGEEALLPSEPHRVVISEPHGPKAGTRAADEVLPSEPHRVAVSEPHGPKADAVASAPPELPSAIALVISEPHGSADVAAPLLETSSAPVPLDVRSEPMRPTVSGAEATTRVESGSDSARQSETPSYMPRRRQAEHR